MKRRAAVCFIAVVGFGCFCSGCKEKRNERVAASYSSATRPTYSSVPPRAPAQAPVGLDAIPAEEDYEERAAANINATNLVSKLTELEKEVAF
jgi:hypothetical protein